MNGKRFSGIRLFAGLLAAAMLTAGCASADAETKKLPIDLRGGAPYQAARAVGQGNVAALAIAQYLNEKEKA